jgi:transmembrane sensor
VDVDQKALVQVLGTSFNISPDENGESISVQVIEGKVSFSSTLKGSDKVILIKDEQATLSAGAIIRADTVDMNFISWKTGQLFFVHENIEKVFSQIEAHYEIEIVTDESVPSDLTFTSTMDNQDLESVLDEISMVLRLDYTHDEDKVEFTSPE